MIQTHTVDLLSILPQQLPGEIERSTFSPPNSLVPARNSLSPPPLDPETQLSPGSRPRTKSQTSNAPPRNPLNPPERSQVTVEDTTSMDSPNGPSPLIQKPFESIAADEQNSSPLNVVNENTAPLKQPAQPAGPVPLNESALNSLDEEAQRVNSTSFHESASFAGSFRSSMSERSEVTEQMKSLQYSSLFLFSGDNPFRLLVHHIVLHRVFDLFILAVIAASCVFISLNDPSKDLSPSLQKAIETADMIFLIIFGVEMALKIVAFGFIWHRGAYLRNPWNRLDFLIVLLGVANYIPGVTATGSSAVRTVRVLRPLRSINNIPEMRDIVTALIRSLPGLSSVLAISALMFFIFGILAVELWSGVFRSRCALDDGNGTWIIPNDTEEEWCKANADPSGLFGYQCPGNLTCVNYGNPFFGFNSYDSFPVAFLGIMQAVTLSSWSDQMYMLIDAWSFLAIIYWIILVSFAAFILVNMTLAVINFQFNEFARQSAAASARKDLKNVLRARVKQFASGKSFVAKKSVLAQVLQTRSLAGLIAREKSQKSVREATTSFSTTAGGEVSRPSRTTPTEMNPHNGDGGSMATRETATPVDEHPSSPSAEMQERVGKRVSIRTHNQIQPQSPVPLLADADLEGGERPDPAPSPTRNAHWMLPAPDDASNHQSISPRFDVRDFSLRIFHASRRYMNLIVENKWFTRIIICLIVVNIVDLAMENQNQSDDQSQALDSINKILTWCFLGEMVMKIYAYGPIGYIKDWFNLLDGIIVIISVIEIGMGGSSSASVFRALRLLRVFKMLHKFESLRLVIGVILRSAVSTGYLNALLLLYLFVAALLGMQFFGGSFDIPGIEKPRATFDGLYWSILCVFQVLTQDNWTDLMYFAMNATSPAAAVYFIGLIVVGNFLLLNLFLAILIKGFEENQSQASATSGGSGPNSRSNSKRLSIRRRSIREQTAGKSRRRSLVDGFQPLEMNSASKQSEMTEGLGEAVVEEGDSSDSDEHSSSGHSSQTDASSNSSYSDLGPSHHQHQPHHHAHAGPGVGAHHGNSASFRIRASSPRAAPANSSPRDAAITIQSPDMSPSTSPRSSGVPLQPPPPLPPPPPPPPPPPHEVRFADQVQPEPRTSHGSKSAADKESSKESAPRRRRLQIAPTGKDTESDPAATTSPNSHIQSQSTIDSSNHMGPSSTGTQMSLLASSVPPAGPSAATSSSTTASAQASSGHPASTTSPRPAPVSSIRMSPQVVVAPDLAAALPTSPTTGGNSDTPLTTHQPQSAGAGRRASLLSSKTSQRRGSTSVGEGTLAIPTGSQVHWGEEVRENDRSFSPSWESSNPFASLFRHFMNRMQRKLARFKSTPVPGINVGWAATTMEAQLEGCYGLSLDQSNLRGVGGGALLLTAHGTYKLPTRVKTNWGNSLFIFGPHNLFRIMCVLIVQNAWFERFIMFCIVLSSIQLAIDNPRMDQESALAQVLNQADYVFTPIFFLEMVLKIVAYGFVMGHGTPDYPRYIKDPWNILDFIIVWVSVVTLLPLNANIGFLRVFRMFRVLRPLRFISRARGLRMVVQTLLRCIPGMINVCIIAAVVFLVFGILGVQLFMGKLYHCTDTNVTERVFCNGTFFNADLNETVPRDWRNKNPQHFDNIMFSVLTLFEVVTLEMWTDMMYNTIDGRSYDVIPVRDANPALCLYFVLFVVIGSFFIMNLFVGVVVFNFQQIKLQTDGLLFITERQRLWIETQRLMMTYRPRIKLRPAGNVFRRGCFRFCINDKFDIVIGICIILNVLLMSMEHYGMEDGWILFLENANYVFVAIFAFEAAVKLVALGHNYFRDNWNRFDFFLVILSIAGVLITILSSGSMPINPTILRIFRVFRVTRILRLVKGGKNIQVILKTLLYSLPSLSNIGLYMLLLFFIYAILGVNMFATVQHGDFINRHANFESVWVGMLTLFRISTGENWPGLMHEYMVQPPDCSGDGCGTLAAPAFFVTFMILAMFINLNLFVAILLDNFANTIAIEKSKLKMSDITRFVDIWSDFDPEATYTIPTNAFPRLLRALKPPLGVNKDFSRLELMLKMGEYNIPEHGGLIHFIEVLVPLARHTLGIRSNPSEMAKTQEQWKEHFPDLWRFPVLYFQLQVVTIEQYFASTYIAAAFRRTRAMRTFRQMKIEANQLSSACVDEVLANHTPMFAGSADLAAAAALAAADSAKALKNQDEFERREDEGPFTANEERQGSFPEPQPDTEPSQQQQQTDSNNATESSPLRNGNDREGDISSQSGGLDDSFRVGGSNSGGGGAGGVLVLGASVECPIIPAVAPIAELLNPANIAGAGINQARISPRNNRRSVPSAPLPATQSPPPSDGQDASASPTDSASPTFDQRPWQEGIKAHGTQPETDVAADLHRPTPLLMQIPNLGTATRFESEVVIPDTPHPTTERRPTGQTTSSS